MKYPVPFDRMLTGTVSIMPSPSLDPPADIEVGTCCGCGTTIYDRPDIEDQRCNWCLGFLCEECDESHHDEE